MIISSLANSIAITIHGSISWPALSVTPLAVALVELVDLPSRRGRVAQVHGFHLLRLDDYNTEVCPGYWILKILDLLSSGKIFVIVRLVYRLTRRRILERA